MTQCAKIIVGFVANVGNVFYATFTHVFYYFSTFFNVFLTFFIFISTFITSMPSSSSELEGVLTSAIVFYERATNYSFMS